MTHRGYNFISLSGGVLERFFAKDWNGGPFVLFGHRSPGHHRIFCAPEPFLFLAAQDQERAIPVPFTAGSGNLITSF